MKIKELIEKLNTMPADSDVICLNWLTNDDMYIKNIYLSYDKTECVLEISR